MTESKAIVLGKWIAKSISFPTVRSI